MYDINRTEYATPDEDTYVEEDLFDHLDYIEGLRAEHTQQEIADKMGWTRSTVANYSSLLSNVVTEVVEIAKSNQTGRVTENVPTETFTERWFRDSGLYDLNREGTTEYAQHSTIFLTVSVGTERQNWLYFSQSLAT